MASNIKNHHVYVPVTPYVAGATEETFNEVDVMTSYDSDRKYFYVDLHAGWRTPYGHGCIFLGDDDPLTAPKWVKVKDAKRNSQKTINEIGAALELAQDGIRLYFDARLWQQLYDFVRYVALYGYTPHYQQQVADMKAQLMKSEEEPVMRQVDVMALMGALKTKGCAKLSDFATHISTNESNNKEDKDMRLNLDANKNETANVQDAAQVANPIEDAVAVEVKDETQAVASVEVAEVTDIIPPAPKQKPKEDKPVTIPLSDHGTMVVGGVPRHDEPKPEPEKPKVTLKKKAPQADPDAIGELGGMLTKVEFVTYKTKKGADAPKIVGFGEDDERWKKIREAKPKWVSAGYRNTDDGKEFFLMFGSRYMAVAKALAEAYNTTDKDKWAKAEAACSACYEGIVSGFKAEKEAKKQERAAAKAAKQEQAKPEPEKSYTLEEVAAALNRILPDGKKASFADIEKLLKAA